MCNRLKFNRRRPA